MFVLGHFAVDLSEIGLPWTEHNAVHYTEKRFNLKFLNTWHTYLCSVTDVSGKVCVPYSHGICFSLLKKLRKHCVYG